jgi:hypothetical protein
VPALVKDTCLFIKTNTEPEAEKHQDKKTKCHGMMDRWIGG